MCVIEILVEVLLKAEFYVGYDDILTKELQVRCQAYLLRSEICERADKDCGKFVESKVSYPNSFCLNSAYFLKQFN